MLFATFPVCFCYISCMLFVTFLILFMHFDMCNVGFLDFFFFIGRSDIALFGLTIVCEGPLNRNLKYVYLHSARNATPTRLIFALFDWKASLNCRFCLTYDSTSIFIPFVTLLAVSSLRVNCWHGSLVSM